MKTRVLVGDLESGKVTDWLTRSGVPSEIRQGLEADGYDIEAAAEDMVYTFENRQKRKGFKDLTFRDTGRVKQEWRSEALYNKAGQNRSAVLSGDNVEGFQKVYDTMNKSKSTDMILKFANGDPQQATQMLLQAATDMANRYGMAGMNLDWILQYLLELMNKGCDPSDENGVPSWMSGMADADLIRKALDIMALVTKLKIRYIPFAKRTMTEQQESDIDAEDINVERLRNFEPPNLRRILKSEFLQPEEIFDIRLAMRQTKQAIPMSVISKEARAANVKMLIDVSGSMAADDIEDGKYSRWEYAMASAINLLDQGVLKGSSKIQIIFFDDSPKKPLSGTPQEIIKRLLTGKNFTGGGTSIDRALRAADKLYDPSLDNEMILFSDGDDDSSYKPQQKLTTYIVNGSEIHRSGLKENSDRYYAVV
jgi:hypothetical protein